MQNFYFTFGCGQVNAYKYVIIKAETYEGARNKMFEVFGDKWCGQYSEEFWKSEGNMCKDYVKFAEYTVEEEV